MYFTVSLPFLYYFDNWINCIMSTIDIDITEDEQKLALASQYLSPNTSKLIDKTRHLGDIITQFKSRQNIFSKQQGYIDMKSKITNKIFCFHLNY